MDQWKDLVEYLDRRFDRMELRVDARFDKLEERFHKLRNKTALIFGALGSGLTASSTAILKKIGVL